MILSDRDIRSNIDTGMLKITPFSEFQVQPCSYDITLGKGFIAGAEALKGLGHDTATAIDLSGYTLDSAFFKLAPGCAVLATTNEYVEIPDDLLCQVHGCSSIGRQFVLVHCTAGFVDPGFKGNITLEIVNLGEKPFMLEKGKKIGQLSFQQLTSRCERPYGSSGLGSKYQNQQGVTRAR
jgi:dCTP deaminase